MGSAHNFQPSQIVCLEHEGNRLYAEAIQIVQSRQVCWARPLMLIFSYPADIPPKQSHLYDLRLGVDLLLPLSLFRHALDTEVVPLLMQLQASKTQTDTTRLEAHQQLQIFVRQIWQARQGEF